MRVTYKKSITYKVLEHISASSQHVILRKDLLHLGAYRQISRAIKALIQQKKLVKIGFGIYAKAYESKYAEEALIEGGFDNASREALGRVGVSWELSKAEKAYNNRETQQVPTQNYVRLKSRFRRKITHGNRQLFFEGNINAR